MILKSLYLRESQPLRYIVFFYLYIMQGLPAGFALTALVNHLTGAGLSPSTVGTFVATVGLPWAAQFIWGPFIDRFQGSRLGRRRPWVLLSQSLALVASLGLLVVDDPPQQVGLLCTVFFIHSIFASVQDAAVDAMAISVIPVAERGRINAVMRAGFLIGISVGAAGLATVLAHYGFKASVMIQSVALLLMMCITFFIREQRGDYLLPPWAGPVSRSIPSEVRQDSLRWIFRELIAGLTNRRNLILFATVATVYACQSIFIRAYSMHLIQQLGWKDTAVSVFSGTYGILATVLITVLGGVLADRIGASRLLVVMVMLNSTFLLLFNLAADYWNQPVVGETGLLITALLDPGISVCALPVLMSLCRPGVEGSQFTTYMALINLSDIVGAYISGQALAYLPAPTLGFGCGVMLTIVGVLAGRQIQRITQASTTVRERAG